MAFPEAVRGYYWGKKVRVLLALPPWHQRWNVKGATSWVDKCLGSLPPLLSTSLSETPTRGLGGITSRYFKALWLSFFFSLSLKIPFSLTQLHGILKFSVCPKDSFPCARRRLQSAGRKVRCVPPKKQRSFPFLISRRIGTHHDSKSFATCQILGGRERNRRGSTKRGRKRRYRTRRRVSEEESTLLAPGT